MDQKVRGQVRVLSAYPSQMAHPRRRGGTYPTQGTPAERGKPDALPLGREAARPTDGAAGKGCWRKRKPGGNGPDRGSNFAPPERGLTSSGSCVTRAFGQSSQAGKQMAVMNQLARAMPVSPPVSSTGAPARDSDAWHDIDWRQVNRNVRRLQTRIVKAAQLGSRVLFHRALARLERYAGKLARAVLRGGGGGNAASLPDHPTRGQRLQTRFERKTNVDSNCPARVSLSVSRPQSHGDNSNRKKVELS